eukprot:668129-Amphidinium_carterae.1
MGLFTKGNGRRMGYGFSNSKETFAFVLARYLKSAVDQIDLCVRGVSAVIPTATRDELGKSFVSTDLTDGRAQAPGRQSWLDTFSSPTQKAILSMGRNAWQHSWQVTIVVQLRIESGGASGLVEKAFISLGFLRVSLASEDCASGLGRFKHTNGDEYVGQWESNVAHGLGFYEHRANKSLYQGKHQG